MQKPEMKLEKGKLMIKLGHAVDTDADKKNSAQFNVEIALDVAEVISEIAKKDMPLIEQLLAQVKA